MALADALARAKEQNRFEGAGDDEARARAQMRFEEGEAAKEATRAREDFARQQREMFEQQRQAEQEAVGAFQSQIESQEKPLDIYGRLETERGVPEIRERTKAIRQRSAELEDQLGQLPEDVQSRLSGTLSTDAQRRRVVAKEQEPIVGALGEAGRDLGVESANLQEATADIANMTQLALQRQDKELQPALIRIQQLGDRFARETSGFQQERQLELDALMDKLNRTRALNDQDIQRAFELAQAERSYEESLNQIRETSRQQAIREGKQREFNQAQAALDRAHDFELQRLQASLRPSSGGGQTALQRELALMQELGLSPEEIKESLFGLQADREPTATEQFDEAVSRRALQALNNPEPVEEEGGFFSKFFNDRDDIPFFPG